MIVNHFTTLWFLRNKTVNPLKCGSETDVLCDLCKRENSNWHTDEDIDLEDLEIDDIEMKSSDKQQNKVTIVHTVVSQSIHKPSPPSVEKNT